PAKWGLTINLPLQKSCLADVCFGSKADIEALPPKCPLYPQKSSCASHRFVVSVRPLSDRPCAKRESWTALESALVASPALIPGPPADGPDSPPADKTLQ